MTITVVVSNPSDETVRGWFAMLYVIGINRTNIERFNIFETHTESVIFGEIKYIIRLLKKWGVALENATICNGELKLKGWPHSMTQDKLGFGESYKYTLLTKISDNKFKTISSNGTVNFVNAEELKSYILRGIIANCDFVTTNNETIFKSIDTYTTIKDADFEARIHEKYAIYMAKTKILGLHMDFDYTIEGKEVKLIHYKTKNKKVIIPNFITTIGEGAFNNLDIQEVKLNDGLKYIGSNAFRHNNIKHITIPKTAEFIGTGAFSGNSELILTRILGRGIKPRTTGFNENNFKLSSSETIVVDQIFRSIGK